jgi:hypothetical protein
VPNLDNVDSIKCLWSIDAHCKGIQSYIRTFNEGNYDFILQATPEFLNEKSVWMPNAYDDDIIKPLNIKKEYVKTAIARMSRILPAFGIGGIINKRIKTAGRDYLQNFDFHTDKNRMFM